MLATTVTDKILIDPTRYQIGFEDGMRSMMRGSLCNDQSYLAGFSAGIKLYRCNIPAVKQAPLERGAFDELLNSEFIG